MPVPHHRIDFEHSPDALVEQLVRGVLAGDPVRAERAVAAALRIAGSSEVAERSVFARARRTASALGPQHGAAVADAIDAYVNRPRAV